MQIFSHQKQCVYVIYYMLNSGGFAASCLRPSRRGSSILDCPGQTRALLRLQQPVDLVHVLKTVKGLLLLVPPRTPRSSGYDVYAHAVYLAICYMSCLLHVYVCYMLLYVICLLYVCYMSSSRALLLYVYICYLLLYVICL